MTTLTEMFAIYLPILLAEKEDQLNAVKAVKAWLQQKRESISTWDKYSEEEQEIEIILIDELLEEL